jgi:hypothetical protein
MCQCHIQMHFHINIFLNKFSKSTQTKYIICGIYNKKSCWVHFSFCSQNIISLICMSVCVWNTLFYYYKKRRRRTNRARHLFDYLLKIMIFYYTSSHPNPKKAEQVNTRQNDVTLSNRENTIFRCSFRPHWNSFSVSWC